MRVLLQGVTWRGAGLVSLEAALIVTAVFAAAAIRLGPDGLAFEGSRVLLWRALLVAAVCQITFYFTDLYDLRVVVDRREMFRRVIQALGAASLILALLYFWFPELVLGRGVFAIAAILVITLVVAWRLCWEWLSSAVGPRERILIVGTGAAALALARELRERRELGIEIVGFVIDRSPDVEPTPRSTDIVGTIEDIPALGRQHQVDRVVVSLAEARGRLPMDKLLAMKLDGVAFDHLASVYEEYTGKIALENLRPSWLIFSTGFRKSSALSAGKRTLDIVFAASVLLVGLPVVLLTALAVRLTSPGPVLYHQKRVGLGGRTFTVHKFRSMRVDAEAGTGAVWAQKEDPRVTPLGRFMRKTRLDELPQLWNILKGDMSVVGPRPERPEFVSELTEEIPFYGQRHVVKPGLTGWAQVCYTYGASREDALEKLQYDLFYIKHMSIGLDLFVIFRTIKTVVLRRGT